MERESKPRIDLVASQLFLLKKASAVRFHCSPNTNGGGTMSVKGEHNDNVSAAASCSFISRHGFNCNYWLCNFCYNIIITKTAADVWEVCMTVHT